MLCFQEQRYGQGCYKDSASSTVYCSLSLIVAPRVTFINNRIRIRVRVGGFREASVDLVMSPNRSDHARSASNARPISPLKPILRVRLRIGVSVGLELKLEF